MNDGTDMPMNISGIHLPIDGPPTGGLSSAKRVVKRTLSSRWVTPAWAALGRGRITFLTLHRFAEPEYGLYGHERALVRDALRRLRKEGYTLLAADDAVRRLRDGRDIPRRSVVFTMDDGYKGALDQCADIFLEFDCPLTVFLATGFLDGECWLWWDAIEHACLRSARRRLDVPWNDDVRRLDLTSRRSTISSLFETWEWCKTLTDEDKWKFIAALADVAEVALPVQPPAQYAPLSWSETRALERKGFTFGPHTVTHPILPRTSDAQAEREITESWRRVREELERPVNIFSYPNGSYGDRELGILRRAGLEAAVTTRPTYATSRAAAATGFLEIPRFGYPERPDPVCLIASGFTTIESAIGRIRR